MKKTFYYCLIILLLATIAISKKAKRWETKNNIIIMDNQNYKEIIGSYKNVMVLFYVPFCSRTDALMSMYQRVYNKYYKKKASIKFAKINTYANKEFS